MSDSIRQSTVDFITYKDFTNSRADVPATTTATPVNLLSLYRYYKPALQQFDAATLDRLAQEAFQRGDLSQFFRYAGAYEQLAGEIHACRAEYEAKLAESKELTGFCMRASEPALSEVWDTPEEDAAWAHLG